LVPTIYFALGIGPLVNILAVLPQAKKENMRVAAIAPRMTGDALLLRSPRRKEGVGDMPESPSSQYGLKAQEDIDLKRD
jgi:hypothetical protein